MKLTSPEVIKQIMAKSGLKFNKSLGQNFLIDEEVLEEAIYASGITKDYGVIEIGPGIGTLTARLAESAGKVVAIELDRQIAEYLKGAFAAYNNVEIIQADALKTDLVKIIDEQFANMPVVVVANLPYYITTPLIMKFLEENLQIESITVMIQKEVADRIVADADTKDYGALSVAVQYYGDPKIISIVPPESFMPAPKVTSAIVNIDIKAHIKPNVYDEKMFFNIVKAAFGQRRKTLVNALHSYFNISKEELRGIIVEVCGNESARGETLKICQFAQICEKMKKGVANLQNV